MDAVSEKKNLRDGRDDSSPTQTVGEAWKQGTDESKENFQYSTFNVQHPKLDEERNTEVVRERHFALICCLSSSAQRGISGWQTRHFLDWGYFAALWMTKVVGAYERTLLALETRSMSTC